MTHKLQNPRTCGYSKQMTVGISKLDLGEESASEVSDKLVNL